MSKNINIYKDISCQNLLLKELILRKGKYISGEKISDLLGVSRTAIWKRINNLKKIGYVIDSSTRLGYKLMGSPDLLIPEEIWAKASLSFLADSICYCSLTESTNTDAKKIAKDSPNGTIVIAEEQKKGRGRMGRKWSSPKGCGLWFSIILKPDIPPYEAPKLTLLTSVCVQEAIRNTAKISADIKWPNDILINGKKVCGILTEISAEMDAINYIIIGIGINVNNDDFPTEIKNSATSLKLEKGEVIDRVTLLVNILESFECFYKKALNNFDDILEIWRKNCCNLGKPVKIIGKNESFEGIAINVDEDGSLLVKRENGNIEKVLSGDISLR